MGSPTAAHDEAMRWYAITTKSRSYLLHGDAGRSIGERAAQRFRCGNALRPAQKVFKPDIVQSYCSRMRAALMGRRLRTVPSSTRMPSRRSSDSRKQVERHQAEYPKSKCVTSSLGARSASSYNNTQARAHIEPELTTAQLDKVNKGSPPGTT